MNKAIFTSPLFNASVATALWALQIFAAKLGLKAGAESVLFTFQSYSVAFIFLSIYSLFTGVWIALARLPKKVLSILVIATIIVAVFGGLFFNAGAKLTSAINVGFLTQFSVVITIFLAWVFLKERFDWSKGATVLLVLTGTFLLTTEGKIILPHIGDIFILASGAGWATANVLIRKSLKNTDVRSDIVALLRPLVGLPIIFLLIASAGAYPEPLSTFFDVDILQIDYLGYAALNGFLLTLLWIFTNRTLKVSSASYASIIASATPVLVTILAVIFLGESISSIQMIGAFMIIISGYVAHYLKFQDH